VKFAISGKLPATIGNLKAPGGRLGIRSHFPSGPLLWRGDRQPNCRSYPIGGRRFCSQGRDHKRGKIVMPGAGPAFRWVRPDFAISKTKTSAVLQRGGSRKGMVAGRISMAWLAFKRGRKKRPFDQNRFFKNGICYIFGYFG